MGQFNAISTIWSRPGLGMCDLYITGKSGGTFGCFEDPCRYLSITFAEC